MKIKVFKEISRVLSGTLYHKVLAKSLAPCFVVPLYKGLMLLQLRKDGSYGLFGGGANKGEKGKETAVREFYEETGIKISKDRLKKIISNEAKFYLLLLRSKVKIRVDNESLGFKWVKIDEIKDLSLQSKFKNNLKSIIKELKNENIIMGSRS